MKKRLFAWLLLTVLLVHAPAVSAAVKTMPDGGKFDPVFYAQTYPDVEAAFGSDETLLYRHYKTNGKAEGRLPYAQGTGAAAAGGVKTMPDGGKFDPVFYAQTYPDVAAAFGSDETLLYRHYKTNGKAEGRLPYASAGTGAAVPAERTDIAIPEPLDEEPLELHNPAVIAQMKSIPAKAYRQADREGRADLTGDRFLVSFARSGKLRLYGAWVDDGMGLIFDNGGVRSFFSQGFDEVHQGSPDLWVGDFDKDGKQEVAISVIKMAGFGMQTFSLFIYEINPDGTLAEPAVLTPEGLLAQELTFLKVYDEYFTVGTHQFRYKDFINEDVRKLTSGEENAILIGGQYEYTCRGGQLMLEDFIGMNYKGAKVRVSSNRETVPFLVNYRGGTITIVPAP